MNNDKVQTLLAQGFSVRQVADKLGLKRTEVERIARQLAKQRTVRLDKIVFMVLGLMIIGGIYWAFLELLREPTYQETQVNILRLANSIKPSPESDPWFIKDDRTPTASDAMMAEVKLIESLTAKLNKAIADNADVPEVALEQKLFAGHISPSIFMGGPTRHMTLDVEEAMSENSLEVSFFSHANFTNSIVGRTLLSYQPGMKALLVAALKFTDEKWYGAMVTHELWHAKMHREGAASATAAKLTDSWVEEEVQAHEVEEKVLIARTAGEYGRRLDAIVAKRQARTFERFLVKLQPEDFGQLEELFTPAIVEETDIRGAQYLLNLGFRWAKTHYNGDRLRHEQYEIYRYMIQPQSTNVR